MIKLYIFPLLLKIGVSPMRLYTQECVDLMGEAERQDLQEIDEAIIRAIGDRPCVFMKPTTIEEEERSIRQLKAQVKEWNV
jgi:hypothetical protein